MAELLEKIKEPSLFCFLSLSCDLLFAICFYSGPSSVYIYILPVFMMLLVRMCGKMCVLSWM